MDILTHQSSDVFRWIFLHIATIFGTLFAVTILLGIILNFKRAKIRSRLFNDYVQERGDHFTNPELAIAMMNPAGPSTGVLNSQPIRRVTDGIMDIREFQQPSTGQGFYFDYLGVPMTIFHHCYGGTSPGQSSSVNLRVAKLHHPGLPIFRLEGRGPVALVDWAVGKILEVAGVEGGVHKIDFPAHPRFSERYILLAKTEEDVHAFLSANRLSYFENNTMQGTFVTNSEYMVYFELGMFSDKSSYDSFIARAKAVFDSLVKSEKV